MYLKTIGCNTGISLFQKDTEKKKKKRERHANNKMSFG